MSHDTPGSTGRPGDTAAHRAADPRTDSTSSTAGAARDEAQQRAGQVAGSAKDAGRQVAGSASAISTTSTSDDTIVKARRVRAGTALERMSKRTSSCSVATNDAPQSTTQTQQSTVTSSVHPSGRFSA